MPTVVAIGAMSAWSQGAELEKDYPKKLDKITTEAGEVYESVTVIKVTPSGIRIFHSKGAAGIPFENLSKDLQEKFGGFDPEEAAAYRSKQNKAQRALRRAANRQEKEAMEKSKAAEEARQLEEEEAQKLKQLEAKKQKFGVEVLRVLPNGVVANILTTITTGVGSQKIGGGGGGAKTTVVRSSKVIYLEGLSGVGETRRLAVIAAPDGTTFSYETPKKEKKTLDRWILLKNLDEESKKNRSNRR